MWWEGRPDTTLGRSCLGRGRRDGQRLQEVVTRPPHCPLPSPSSWDQPNQHPNTRGRGGGGLDESPHPEQKKRGLGSAPGSGHRRGRAWLGRRTPAWHVGAVGRWRIVWPPPAARWAAQASPQQPAAGGAKWHPGPGQLPHSSEPVALDSWFLSAWHWEDGLSPRPARGDRGEEPPAGSTQAPAPEP